MRDKIAKATRLQCRPWNTRDLMPARKVATLRRIRRRCRKLFSRDTEALFAFEEQLVP